MKLFHSIALLTLGLLVIFYSVESKATPKPKLLEERGFFDKFKFEDGKIKYPVGKDKSITIGGDPTGKGLGASVGFEWKFGKRSALEKRGFFDKFKFENGKIKYPVGKDGSITIGGSPTGKGLGASVGFEWKFGKRSALEKRGFFDKFKFENGKIKYPVGKDGSITVGGSGLGFEWKFGKRRMNI